MPLRPLRAAPGALLLAALSSTLLACGSGGAPAERLPTRSQPLLSLFEADVPLHADPAATLDELRRLGVDTVRVFLPWGDLGALGQLAPSSLSPAPPTGFDGADPAAYPPGAWRPYDTIIARARARGLNIDLTLGPPPPLWARGPGDPGHPPHPQWRPSAAEFAAFVRAVGTRYSGHYSPPGATRPLPRVDFWAIWNEPNFGPMVAPQTVGGVDESPAIYRSLVDGAWQALQATGHGGDTILIGELAPFGRALAPGPGRFGYMVPLRFLRELYCVDGRLHRLAGAGATALGCPSGGSPAAFRAAHPALFAASGLAVHPYSQGPPTVSVPGEPDYANLAALPRVEVTLDGALRAYGSTRRMPLYSTEFGVHTNPPETVFGTVSPAVAAAVMNQSEYLSWRDPRVRSYSQYLLRDGATGSFATGLQFADGRPKPGLAAYRLPLYLPVTRLHGTGTLEVWGCARAAPLAAPGSRGHVVKIQFRPTGTRTFRTLRVVKLSAGGRYFDVAQRFAGPGSVRLAWAPPGAATMFSRTVIIASD